VKQLKTKIMKLYLDFSVDYSGECEDFEIFIDDVEKTDDVSFDDVTNYIKKLEENVEDFFLSEHRTSGIITITDDVMTIEFRTFNEPDWDNFDDHTITTTPIDFN
jgi:hypothetical protein